MVTTQEVADNLRFVSALGESVRLEAVERIIHRWGCSCFFLSVRTPEPHDIVVKLWRSANACEDASAQFSKLNRFKQAVAEKKDLAETVFMPDPLGLLQVQWMHGYVMARVNGNAVGNHCVTVRPRPSGEEIARALVRALSVYHELFDECYGDFHAGNVIIATDGRVCLLDPGYANCSRRRLHDRDQEESLQTGRAGQLLASDIGNWLEMLVVASVKNAILRPRETHSLWNVSRALVHAAHEHMTHEKAEFDADLLAAYQRRIGLTHGSRIRQRLRGIGVRPLNAYARRYFFR